jgi:hypothetical protein
VFDQISGKLNLGFADIGQRSLKNIARPVHAYKFERSVGPAPAARPAAGGWRSTGWMAVAAAVGVVALAAAYFAGVSDSADTTPVSSPASGPAGADEETRLRLRIAEAERAKAEAELARLRAGAAEGVAAPAAPQASTSQAPAGMSAPPPASVGSTNAVEQPAPEPAASPDRPAAAESAAFTRGFAQLRCQRPDGTPAIVGSGPVTVTNGEVIIDVGEAGQRGFAILRGRPAADGRLVLEGVVTPRAGRGRGVDFPVRYEGRLVGGRATLVGQQGRTPCALILQLQ